MTYNDLWLSPFSNRLLNLYVPAKFNMGGETPQLGKEYYEIA